MTNINIQNRQNYAKWAAIAALIFSFEAWILGPLSWIYGYGSGLETIPVFKALSIENRNFSFWASFIGGGVDRLAFWGNASPFSIEQVLFTFFPTWLANGIDRFLQYFVAFYFTSLVAEEQCLLNRRWSLLAGWLMGAFSYLTVGALFTISGVPLLLWLLYRLFNPNLKWYMAILFGWLFSFCTTFSFGVPYFLTFSAGWFLLIKPIPSYRVLKQFIFFFISLCISTSSQLFAIITNVVFSHRSSWPSEGYNFSTLDGFLYRQLQFDMFAQDRYLSLLTMNLPLIGLSIGFGLAIWLQKQSKVRLFANMYIKIYILYFILSQKWLWLFVQKITSKIFPWVMGIYMGRFYQIPGSFLIAIGLTFTCFFVWNNILLTKVTRKIGIAIVCLFLSFMVLWPKWHLLYPLGVHDWGEKNYQIHALEGIKKKEVLPFRVASVLPLQPAYAYAQGLEAADGWANLIPAYYRDLWLEILSPLLKKLPAVKQILDPENGKPQDNYIFLGLDLIQPAIGLLPEENIKESLIKGFDIDSRFNLNMLGLLNVKYILSEYPLRSSKLKLFHKPANYEAHARSRCYATGLITDRYIKDPKPFSVNQVVKDFFQASKKKLEGKDIFIYELNTYLPRFRFINHIVIEPNKEAVLARLASFDSTTHQSTGVMQLQDAKELGHNTSFLIGKVKLLNYEADKILLETTTYGNSLLVISNTWNPHWVAKVNGSKRKLIRINHTQFALPLFKGDSEIILYYAPPYLPNKIIDIRSNG